MLISCQGIKTVNSDMEEEQLWCENDIAKAIWWVDWKRGEGLSGYGSVRTVKVHANVYSDGTFRIMSFCKKQMAVTEDNQKIYAIADLPDPVLVVFEL